MKLSHLWPWSQIEWWKSQTGGLASQLEAATTTERYLRSTLDAMAIRAARLQRESIETKVRNSQLALEVIQLQKKLDDAQQELGELKEFIDGTAPRTVLHPPELQAASAAIGELVGLEPPPEPKAVWPFPTSSPP